jgi:hypothetical protein
MWEKPSYLEVEPDGVKVTFNNEYGTSTIKLDMCERASGKGPYIRFPHINLDTAEEMTRMIEAMAQARTLLINKKLGIQDG